MKVLDTVMMNKTSIAGLGVCYWMGRRFSSNVQELERNTQEKKLFDPLKAKAQIEVYKEIYNMEEGHERPKDTALKILETAEANDIEKINRFFDKQNEYGQSEIDKEMDRLKREIDSLEEV